MKWNPAVNEDLFLQTSAATLNGPFPEFRHTGPVQEVCNSASAKEAEEKLPDEISRKAKRKLDISYSPTLSYVLLAGEKADEGCLQTFETGSDCDVDMDIYVTHMQKFRKRRKFQAAAVDSEEDVSRGHSSEPTEKQKTLALQLQRAMIADEDGDRPIHIAVVQEDIRLVKKLSSLMKKAGASLDITNHLRQTPLHLAVIVGNTEAAKVLLSSGASLHVKDRHGSNAVQLAVKFYHRKTFALIMSHCSSRSVLNSMDYDGCTALHYAVYQRNAEAVEGLCEAGADIDAVDGKSGRTALVNSVLAGYVDMANLLLSHNACPEKTDYAGWSAAELALQSGNRTMMRLFESRDSAHSDSFGVADTIGYSHEPSANENLRTDHRTSSVRKKKTRTSST